MEKYKTNPEIANFWADTLDCIVMDTCLTQRELKAEMRLPAHWENDRGAVA